MDNADTVLRNATQVSKSPVEGRRKKVWAKALVMSTNEPVAPPEGPLSRLSEERVVRKIWHHQVTSICPHSS